VVVVVAGRVRVRVRGSLPVVAEEGFRPHFLLVHHNPEASEG
jgi:hypothetical protein